MENEELKKVRKHDSSVNAQLREQNKVLSSKLSAAENDLLIAQGKIPKPKPKKNKPMVPDQVLPPVPKPVPDDPSLLAEANYMTLVND